MLVRPNLSDAVITAALQTHYGIKASAITFLPVGNDVNAFAFKVIDAKGEPFFLKARRGEVNLPALVIPCHVLTHGVPAVAPITTQAGSLWVDAGAFHLILYPFIEGESGMDAGMSDAQWVAYGAALRRLHEVKLSADLQSILPVEDFSAYPYYQDVLQRVDALVNTSTFQDDTLRDLAAFWHRNAGTIKHITQRARELGSALKATAWRGMLCHADIHTANVMVERNGAIYFVDWDQPIFAPKERDLMFVRGDRQDLFFQGYGAVEIDRQMMAYYHHWWVVQDMGDYAERAFLMNDADDEVRAHAAAGFKAMFDAGDAIEIAINADARISTQKAQNQQ